MWDSTDLSLWALDSSYALNGQHLWYPISREKRARYGAPVLGEGMRAYEAEFVGPPS